MSDGTDHAAPAPDWHEDWPHLLLVLALLTTLYLFTAPRTVVMEDDGMFIMSSVFLGIEHPPGYPLYVLLGHLAQLMPLGTPAWRVHALSGLFAAAACVIVWLIARRLIPGRAPAYAAALGLGASDAFWSQAIIADVYSLNALLFFALLYLALSLHRQPAKRKGLDARLALMALLTGLALANHWPLLLLSLPGVALLVLPSWRQLLIGLPRLMLLLAVGLTPYAWMAARSLMSPEMSWSGPILSLSELLHYVSRADYGGIDDSVTAGWLDRLGFLRLLVSGAFLQLTPLGLLLATVGFWQQLRRWPGAVVAALLLAFTGPTLLLIALLNFDDEWLLRAAFRPYPLIAWGILALWMALGVHWLAQHLKLATANRVAVALVIPLASLALHWQANDRHDDRFAHAYAEATLRSLPPNATLFANGDVPIHTIGYLNRVLGVRPDVQLLGAHGLPFEPMPFDPRATTLEQQHAMVRRHAFTAAGPVFLTHGAWGGPGVQHWLYQELRPRHDAMGYALTPRELTYLEQLIAAGEQLDGWNESERRRLLTRFVEVASAAQIANQPLEPQPQVKPFIEQALELPEAMIARLLVLGSASGSRAEVDTLLGQIPSAMDQHVDKRLRALYFYALARRAAEQGNPEISRQALEQAIRVWPHPENPARRMLERPMRQRRSGG